MSIEVKDHAVLAWQKRFGQAVGAKESIRKAHRNGISVEVVGKTKNGVFCPSYNSILVVKGQEVKTVLFVENQELVYLDRVSCQSCGRLVDRSVPCSRCQSTTHRYDGNVFNVEW